MTYPKISIVTPNYNGEKYLEETILSVISQEYPNLEYIIVDGGSTDHSIDIIKKYETHLSDWISEKDNGMYDAIHKGFSLATGEIMGWINSDDILYPKSLLVLANIFHSFKKVHWITGCSSTIDMNQTITSVLRTKTWHQNDFLMGEWKYIQQESTFWRSSLYHQVGGINTNLRYAGDFDLWLKFITTSPLHTVDTVFGAFRIHSENQLSQSFRKQYQEEVDLIYKSEKVSRTLLFLLYKLLKRTTLYLDQQKFLTLIPHFLLQKIFKYPARIGYSHSSKSFQYFPSH